MDEENNEGRAEIYELGYHIVSSVAESDLPQEVNAIKSFIEEKGGIIISDEFPKIKPLFYTMYKAVNGAKKHYNSAYFGWIKFEINSDNIPAVEKVFKNDNDVIRFLLISTVRENTLSASAHRTGGRTAARAEKSAMSEEEIEKTVEALVAE